MHAPSADCQICPRLAAFRGEQRAAYPDWFNRPVPSFGPEEAAVLVVGLAPGLRGANRTGRPFTGDFAGDLLYATLLATGFATGEYKADPDDGLTLVNCRITKAVRCLPPQNKPVGAEIANCRPFLAGELQGVQGLQVVVALGRIAHDSLLRTLGVRLASYPFAHGALHEVGGLVVADSYHCSRYNTQTGRLTEAMFRSVFEQVKVLVDR
jgi:uracil-DNA glycosylase family 4